MYIVCKMMTGNLTFARAFILIAVFAILPNLYADEVDDATRAWVAANRTTAIDLLFPSPNMQEDTDSNTAWIAVIRVSPSDPSDNEFYIRMTKYESGRVAAHIVSSVGGSIPTQLARIHSAQPSLSAAQAVPLLHVRTRDVTDRTAPALRSAANALEHARGQYVFDNVMMLDATRYELWTIGGPRRLYVTLLGPAMTDASPRLPLLKAFKSIQMIAERLR